MGVNADFPPSDGLVQLKVAKGTKNFAREPAMSAEECEEAIINGYDLIRKCDADIVGAGEMGIGNSSSAAALYSLYLDLPAKTTAGAGTGSVGELYARKVDTIQLGLDLHKIESSGNPLEILRRVGGLEICGMVGAIFGAAAKRVPVVVDGFIAGAAACAASRIAPASKGYIIYSHTSAEKFHREYLETEKAKPVLDLDMCLGEGTGAILALQIIQQAMACYNQMATFSSAGVSGKDTDDD
jgi:nicotinate-nucleotide--dimethylbenzimidazole phosphoribosyltransferase